MSPAPHPHPHPSLPPSGTRALGPCDSPAGDNHFLCTAPPTPRPPRAVRLQRLGVGGQEQAVGCCVRAFSPARTAESERWPHPGSQRGWPRGPTREPAARRACCPLRVPMSAHRGPWEACGSPSSRGTTQTKLQALGQGCGGPSPRTVCGTPPARPFWLRPEARLEWGRPLLGSDHLSRRRRHPMTQRCPHSRRPPRTCTLASAQGPGGTDTARLHSASLAAPRCRASWELVGVSQGSIVAREEAVSPDLARQSFH